MANKKQKNFRMSPVGEYFLNLLQDGTPYNITETFENLLLMGAIVFQRESLKAQQFLYRNLVHSLTAQASTIPPWVEMNSVVAEHEALLAVAHAAEKNDAQAVADAMAHWKRIRAKSIVHHRQAITAPELVPKIFKMQRAEKSGAVQRLKKAVPFNG